MKQVLRVIAYAFVIPTVLFFSCGDDDESPLLVEADFSVNDSSIVAGQEVTFTDNSTGEPTSWEWSFEGGDPSSSTAQDPKVTYTTPGVYSVTLTASNGENSGTKEKEEWITVVLRIEADFSVNDSLIVVGQEVTFTDTSQGEPTSWEWSFEGGDPSSSTAQGPKVIYTTPGVYPVTLTASNGESSDTEEKKEFITVISEIEADFFVNDSSIVVGQEVTFTDISTGEPTNWAWSFEGGNPSSATVQNPKVTYSAPGEYSVTLTASNEDLTGSIEKENFIKVFLPVEASFTADQVILFQGDQVSFTNTSEGAPSDILWTFEGGTPATSTDPNPVVTYDIPGTYNVTLSASNEASSDTEEKEAFVKVVGPVTTQFEADKLSVIAGEDVTFTDRSFGEPNSWQWSF
ncbi:MAG: PKD domain-containing protein, partial [Cytophagales bacterium]|nr:PKD domain-containing protein [Cytophagales bacterium]